MRAKLLLKERVPIGDDRFVDLRVWNVPTPVEGSAHEFKYSLAFIVRDVCVLRYDNEAGKGDHKHHGADEQPYKFITPERLIEDFWTDVNQWSE